MKCFKCGYPVLPKYKVCPHCGTTLTENQPVAASGDDSEYNAVSFNNSVKETINPIKSIYAMQCPKCGNIITKAGQKFCTKCGTALTTSQANNESQQKISPVDETGKKGFVDNVTHFGTFLRQGSEGVQRAVRREEQSRVTERARELGLEVSKPIQGNNANATTSIPTPTERRLLVDTDSVEGVSIVQGRAIWNIQKGQVARLITEAEFANAGSGLKGVIVQEGCTAMVLIDGQIISLLQSGIYTFPAKTVAEIQLDERQRDIEAEAKRIEEREKELEKLEIEKKKEEEKEANSFRNRGVFGKVAAFGRGVMNFLFGHKKDESPVQHQKRTERIKQKLNKISSPKVCRVYLVNNQIINLLFGSITDEKGEIAYTPLTIPTKLVDLQVGVSMQLQVTNMQMFVQNYLVDRTSVTALDLQAQLLPAVNNTLTQLLRNLDYQQEGLPEPIVENLKVRIQSHCNERLQGIEVVRVLDVTDKSRDFERFRSVERELFATEKEIGFLQRTNEFKDRLEIEQNKLKISQATNAENLRQSLQAVNKDKLLSEDEMENFVLLLASQKRLREAKSKEEEYEALIDLKKNRLVKDDDIEALANTLEQGKISRENVTDIMRVQTEQKLALTQQIADFLISDNAMDHEFANELKQARHKGELYEAEMEIKRKMDAYADERRQYEEDHAFNQRQRNDDYDFAQAQRQQTADLQNRQANEDYDFQKQQREQMLREQQTQADYSRQRQDKFDDMDILERKAAIAQRNMQAMKEAELAVQRESNRSAESMHAMDTNVEINRDNAFTQMSADEIRAAQLSRLSEEAQVAMAQSYGSDKENELRKQQQTEQKALYEQMMQQQNAQNAQQQEMMMQMAKMMQQGMLQAGNQQMASQQQMYQQQQAFQQQRYDEQLQIKEEYRENAMHQQNRMDHTQDQALGHVGTVSHAAAQNINSFKGVASMYAQQVPQTAKNTPQQSPTQNATKQCPGCGAQIDADETFCPECGSRV